jgi:transposase
LPPDNNRVENLIRPIATGRNNWLFARSLRAGRGATGCGGDEYAPHPRRADQRAEPLAYLTDVLDRLPTQSASRIDELLPYHWQPTPTPQPDTLAPA